MQVSLLTNTREFLVMSRHNLIPQWLAHVNPKTGTPIRIILLYGVVTCEALSQTPLTCSAHAFLCSL